MKAAMGWCSLLWLSACAAASPSVAPAEYYGTLQPFAREAVYFVMTDRFVNGDPGNDQRDQGGDHPTFDLPLTCPDGVVANLGYQGGDFRGVLDQANYIRDLGFSAVWITPIIDNPDQAFTGGDPVTCSSFLSDRGKSGYHGYWGMNFYRLDEHWPSPGLDFATFTRKLREHGLGVVLDIVANHASPGYTMPVKQAGFGQVFAADGSLLADHGNLPPEQLNPAQQPLHAFFRNTRDLAQLADFDYDNPAVEDYLVGAYLHWLDQGVHALRVDTARHMPLSFWRRFNARLRVARPELFLFAEAFDYDATKLAPFTFPENGGMSVLDFPLKAALSAAVGKEQAGFETLGAALALQDGPYQNPYELATFYDNHDMARLDADDNGFIDAHNWLFTARGIPVIYYGSEIGFMRGRAEHHGNRNYFGIERIHAAPAHPIYQALRRIAKVRENTLALQQGLQINLELQGDRAVFYRVYQHAGRSQLALVLLNKGEQAATFQVAEALQPGVWNAALSAKAVTIAPAGMLSAELPAHGVEVFVLDAPVTEPALLQRLNAAMAGAQRRSSGG